MDAGSYNFAIAFQERIKISDEKMAFYEVTFFFILFLGLTDCTD